MMKMLLVWWWMHGTASNILSNWINQHDNSWENNEWIEQTISDKEREREGDRKKESYKGMFLYSSTLLVK